MHIYKKDRYIAPYEWLISVPIREYDLAKANISILLDQDLISQKQYDYYASLPKHRREIEIGLLVKRDRSILDGLKRGFVNARRLFIEANEIEESRILYIDKDSITTVEKAVKYTTLNKNLKFILKNEYTSFYRVFLVDFLYFNDNHREYFRIKNANNEFMHKKHVNGMLELALTIAYDGQFNPVVDTLRMINYAYRRYTQRELDLDFYREFNPRSRFKFLSTPYTDYYIDLYNKNVDLNLLDISYNADVIRLFYKVFAKTYFDMQ